MPKVQELEMELYVDAYVDCEQKAYDLLEKKAQALTSWAKVKKPFIELNQSYQLVNVTLSQYLVNSLSTTEERVP